MNKKLLFCGIFLMVLFISCQEQLDPRVKPEVWPLPDPESLLIGTSWVSDTEAFSFQSAEKILYNEQLIYYRYNSAELRGLADYLGSFTVTQDYNKITFKQWMNFPCGRTEIFTKENP